MIPKDKLVYICSPLSAPTRVQIFQNMEKAEFYAEYLAEQFHCRAVAPHGFLPRYLDDQVPTERELCLEFGLKLLKLCSAMVVCGNRISSGMKGEIQKAKEWGIPVFMLLEYTEGFALVKMRQEGETVDEMQICKGCIPE